jgi:chromosomal replication initiator protein
LGHQEIWSQIKSSILSKNSKNSPLSMWLMPAELLGIETSTETEDHCFKLGVPTELHKYWICNNLLEIITSEISALFKGPFRIELEVTGRNIDVMGRDEFDRLSVAPDPAPVVVRSVRSRDNLNPDHTFSTFVVGRNNEFAHAACHSVAENPGAGSYNPLFICGPTGMGKTHLLNAVGNHIKDKFPHLTIMYCSAERFLNDCVSAIRHKEMYKFRDRYREQCQVLLMDDIHVLGNTEAVQEEFFHTLNEFFEKGHQVVVASDRMPRDIQGMEDRIRTRLEWGLIADIKMPDVETRVAILRYKAERHRLGLSNEVVNYLARISKRSIRELEGNLNKLKMLSELQGIPINMDLAKTALLGHDDTRTITIDEIQRLVADHYNLRVPDLKGKSRTQPLVTARQLSMFLIKKHLDKSLVEIGRSFGGRDHTTVLNAMRKIEELLSADADLKRDFDDLQGRIHNLTGV